MERILTERDRLLAATARATGLISALIAAACLCLPGALPAPGPLTAVLVALAIVAFGFSQLGVASPLWLLILIDVAAIAAICLIAIFSDGLNEATASALPWIAGGCVAAPAIVLITSGRRIVMLVLSFCAAMIALGFALGDLLTAYALLFTLAGWGFAIILALWLGRIVPQSVLRIASMTDAYRAERHASEAEAQRRQGARLLHDTVLATLTLLAHSGVGVNAQALREQAKEDAALLRQLRMGYTPNPVASGDYKLRPVTESALGNTLESVKQRFARMGLEVNWHGQGQILLPGEVLDAFLLALQESLENVRRHSGVSEAHVTITDDDETVRAMVTDSGVGFSLEKVPAGRLGFTDSIVARLREVGGSARLFSAPGSGTTVVLEVPK